MLPSLTVATPLPAIVTKSNTSNKVVRFRFHRPLVTGIIGNVGSPKPLNP